MAFDPTSIAGCMAWYDFADNSTITASAGAVSQVTDKSGSGHTLTQSTAGLKPTTGLNTINAKNVLHFLNNRLDTATFTQAQPITGFAIGQLDTASGVNRQMLGNGGTSPTLYQGSTTVWRMYASTEQGTIPSTTNVTLLSGIFNGASSQLYVNGVLDGTFNPGTNGYLNLSIFIGNDVSAGAPWLGNIAEVILYNSALSDPNRNNVEQYLLLKWKGSRPSGGNNLRPHAFSPGLAR